MPKQSVPVRLACHAMATRFEIALYGDDPIQLRAAGEEALGEIARLEGQLSYFRPESEIYVLNTLAAHEPVQVTPPTLNLLQFACRLSEVTDGAFDPTVAPLLRCWGFIGGSGHPPDMAAVEAARLLVGMNLVELDEERSAVRYLKPGIQIDLGSIGKGYAIEKAAEILRENGIHHALIHGGTSTLTAIGSPPDADGWDIAIQRPSHPEEILTRFRLRDESLSVSGVYGKAFEWEGKRYGHVIDPRTGWPVEGAQLAAVVLPSATETDALSTALLVLGAAGLSQLTKYAPSMRTYLLPNHF